METMLKLNIRTDIKQHQDFREFISSNRRIVIDQRTSETQKLLQSTGSREKCTGSFRKVSIKNFDSDSFQFTFSQFHRFNTVVSFK